MAQERRVEFANAACWTGAKNTLMVAARPRKLKKALD
jgi:hypothetical protein